MTDTDPKFSEILNQQIAQIKEYKDVDEFYEQCKPNRKLYEFRSASYIFKTKKNKLSDDQNMREVLK